MDSEAFKGSYPEGWVLAEAPEEEERVADKEFWSELTFSELAGLAVQMQMQRGAIPS